jgi:HSP20 family molecular chaperone IbpA
MGFNNFDALINDVTKVLESSGHANYRQKTRRPEYVQHKNDEGYRLEIPAIGALRENVAVQIENSVLKVEVTPSVDSAYARNFNCEWSVPEEIDADSVSAKLENGLLTVGLKRKQPESKKVNVTVN